MTKNCFETYKTKSNQKNQKFFLMKILKAQFLNLYRFEQIDKPGGALLRLFETAPLILSIRGQSYFALHINLTASL